MEWSKDIKLNNKQYRIKKANDGKHKYVVYLIFNDKEVFVTKFGDVSMEQYRDRFEQYKHLDHNNKKRYDSFRSRFRLQYEKIKNDPSSGLWWSWNYLW